MSNHRRVGSSPISRTKIAKVHRTLAILFFPSAQKRPPAEDPPEAFCIYEERRRLSNDEVQDHERAQQVHDRVDLLGLAAHELDEHVHDDAAPRPLVMLPVKAVNIIMTQGPMASSKSVKSISVKPLSIRKPT